MPGTFARSLREALSHPLTRGRQLDSPRTTELRRRVIRGKPGLSAIYADWYRMLAKRIPAGAGAILELGAGAGFLERFVPAAITSEILPIRGVDLVCDGCALPFAAGSLRAIVLVDVLHHIPDCERFFASASACLRPGGRLLMIEPWATPLSRQVYRRLHHEPFITDAREWRFPSSGPLSSANGGLPWMIFARDRERFGASFPSLRLREVAPLMPFRYLLSAGVAMRVGAPAWLDALVRRIEGDSATLRRAASMFARLVIERA